MLSPLTDPSFLFILSLITKMNVEIYKGQQRNRWNEINVARAWSGVGAPISQKPRQWSVPGGFIYIYILYCIYIKKNTQNGKLVVKYMKTCIFVLLVDEYYIIMKIEMASIVH